MTPDIKRAAAAIRKWREGRITDGFAQTLVIAVLEALTEPSEKAVEAAAEAMTEGTTPVDDGIRYLARAALHAARLAELGRTKE